MAMAQEETQPGPDLTLGIPLDQIPDGRTLVGHVGVEDVLLVRHGNEVFAVGAHCTHYHGPLADGLVIGDTVRCPWHHACFDLRTGEALEAPAMSPIACWAVERHDGKITVREKREQPKPKPRGKRAGRGPEKIVIVGGGAAGFAAAEMLRRQSYQGSIVMLSSDEALPYDRPNLSKDYLAGSIPFDYVPLQPESFYAENGIEVRLGQAALEIDPHAREVVIAGADKVAYDRLLLATGAEPLHLVVPGARQPHVQTLRSLADCHAIIERAQAGRLAVVIGASFIGLEVAAALRARKLDVHVVAPEKRPMERILGPQIGDFLRALHEEHGVVFHLEDAATGIDGRLVKLKSGGLLRRISSSLASAFGRASSLLRRQGSGSIAGSSSTSSSRRALLTSTPPATLRAGRTRIRARQSALNTGSSPSAKVRPRHSICWASAGPSTAVPFFWSQHYDIPINYVGHAEKWDEIAIDGDVASRDCLLRFKRNGRVLAVASIFRDVENLQAEVTMERAAAA